MQTIRQNVVWGYSNFAFQSMFRLPSRQAWRRSCRYTKAYTQTQKRCRWSYEGTSDWLIL